MEKAKIKPENSAVENTVSVDEFCSQLSISDKRTELIGSFYRSSVSRGLVKQTEAVFSDMYSNFCNQPA